MSYSPRHLSTRAPSTPALCSWCEEERVATHLITRTRFGAEHACFVHALLWALPGERVVRIGRHAADRLSTVHATPTR